MAGIFAEVDRTGDTDRKRNDSGADDDEHRASNKREYSVMFGLKERRPTCTGQESLDWNSLEERKCLFNQYVDDSRCRNH